MSYAALIDKQVHAAFMKVKDLAVDSIFTKNTATNFDFNSATLAKTNEAPKPIKVVPIDVKKKSSKTNTITKTLMAKATDVGDLNLYDKINFQSFDWKLGDVLHETGRVWIFNVYREA